MLHDHQPTRLIRQLLYWERDVRLLRFKLQSLIPVVSSLFDFHCEEKKTTTGLELTSVMLQDTSLVSYKIHTTHLLVGEVGKFEFLWDPKVFMLQEIYNEQPREYSFTFTAQYQPDLLMWNVLVEYPYRDRPSKCTRRRILADLLYEDVEVRDMELYYYDEPMTLGAQIDMEQYALV